MKYCYNCNRVTVGNPLFCNFCGKSYNVKLCPRLHVNPRSAEVCSQCGSRDLSAPQPKVPFWGKVFIALITLVLWIALLYFTFLIALVFLKQVFSSPNVINDLIGIGIILALLWWIWMQIPLWLRKIMHRLLRGKDKDRKR
ncbi:MAG: zinc ribbon domain-containing protein [Terriglobia bacterium]|jgi:RNA polymerase subunit RPABC4/transcription elongation factor Spt4